MFTAGWNSAAPLAAGNAVIIKPSEFTLASSVRLAQLAHEAGLPAGVFNVATGLGQTVGSALTSDRRVGKVSFIGSVPTGRRVAVAAAQAGIPALLELGGKSANIVFADADLDRAADGAVSAIFSGAGQSCVAGSRLLVERSVHAQFVELVAGKAGRLRVGDPLSADTEVGPIITAQQFATVTSLIEAGLNDGGRRVTGATLPDALAGSGLAGRPLGHADPARRGDAGEPARNHRGFRSRGGRGRVRHGSRGHRAGQQHQLRPGRCRCGPRASPAPTTSPAR